MRARRVGGAVAIVFGLTVVAVAIVLARPFNQQGAASAPSEPLLRDWTAVEWRPMIRPFPPAQEAGHDRIEGLVQWGEGLLGWGRMETPGRNQFNDMAAIYRSPDGVAWERQVFDAGVGPADTAEIRAVLDGPGGLVALGGVCCEVEEPALWHSGDGGAWERIDWPAELPWMGVWDAASSPDSYVVVGEEAGRVVIAVSRDGRSWERGAPDGQAPVAGIVADVARLGRGFVAVGRVGADRLDGAVWTSPDAIAWTRIPIAAIEGPLDVELNAVVAFGERVALDGLEGRPGERERCEEIGLIGGQLASVEVVAPSESAEQLICGWGTPTRWVGSLGGPWRKQHAVGAAPAQLPSLYLARRAGPGVMTLTDGPDGEGLELWTSTDGQAWRTLQAIEGFRAGQSVSAWETAGDRIVAVGEDWDPDGSSAGTIGVWVGRLR